MESNADKVRKKEALIQARKDVGKLLAPHVTNLMEKVASLDGLAPSKGKIKLPFSVIVDSGQERITEGTNIFRLSFTVLPRFFKTRAVILSAFEREPGNKHYDQSLLTFSLSDDLSLKFNRHKNPNGIEKDQLELLNHVNRALRALPKSVK